MRFSQDFIDKVRQANNVVEIIGQYTQLKGSGHRLMGRCPFPDHSDKSPSFSVTEDNQLYYCYGCKKGGNVFNFLETFNGLSFPEAVEFLAKRASIPLPEREEKAGAATTLSNDQKDLLLRVNKAAAVFFHHQLKAQSEDSPVRRYLLKRGLSEEIVDTFRLGVALDDWQGLIRNFQARKVPLDAAEKLGLIKPKKTVRAGDSHFDLFRDRLMFPIFAPNDDVVGFGGRTLGDALPKYVNSSDSPVFNKGRILYALNETGRYIRAQDEAIVVEGYMDAISLYAAGIKNVVAILGTAFTLEHAKVLKRYTLNVKMLLDGDDAGIGGAERSLPILLEAGLLAKGFVLPDKLDPDDFVKQRGADALRAEIDRAPELFSLLLAKRWLQGYQGKPSDKVRVIDEAVVALGRMKNRQLYELYLIDLARQLDVEVPWVRRALAQSAAGAARTQTPESRASGGASVGSAGRDGFSSHESKGGAVVESASDISALQPSGQLFGPTSGPTPDAMPDTTSDTTSQKVNQQASQRILLKGAPRTEAIVLSLLLRHRSLMNDLVDAGVDEVLAIVSHPGIRQALSWAVERYQRAPEEFSDIAAALSVRVDEPSVLVSSMSLAPESRSALGSANLGGNSEGLEQRLMVDYLGALRRDFLKNQAKALASELRTGSSHEKLEQFMTLQRDRLGSSRDS
jgi:DNA primase